MSKPSRTWTIQRAFEDVVRRLDALERRLNKITKQDPPLREARLTTAGGQLEIGARSAGWRTKSPVTFGTIAYGLTNPGNEVMTFRLTAPGFTENFSLAAGASYDTKRLGVTLSHPMEEIIVEIIADGGGASGLDILLTERR